MPAAPAPAPGSGPVPSSSPHGVATVFRTPCPVDARTIAHPALPPGLEGLTILHLSDLHIRRWKERGFQRLEALLSLVERLHPDLIALTGDFMTYRWDEAPTLRVMEQLLSRLRARIAGGIVGVFGNHDSHPFRREVKHLGVVQWMDPCGWADVEVGSDRLRIVGASWPEDWLNASLRTPDGATAAPFTLALTHTPAQLPVLSQMGVSIVLAGHTHGGQVRLALPFSRRHWAPHNSTDLPRSMSAGVLRAGSTLCAISRGVGTQFLDLRLNCPWHVPLYTLVRGDFSSGARTKRGISAEQLW